MFLYIADIHLLLLLSRILLYDDVSLSTDGLQLQYLAIINAALSTYMQCICNVFGVPLHTFLLQRFLRMKVPDYRVDMCSTSICVACSILKS